MTAAVEEHKLQHVAINELKFDETNPNQLTEEQMASLRQSMQKFGYLTPIVIDQNNMIADGEHRALVYREFGHESVPCFKLHLQDDIERRMLRQVMNKLHGRHDNVMDANELVQIFQAGKLDELTSLIAKKNLDIAEEIMKHSTTANKELLDQLFGEDSALKGTGSLSKKYGVPPFSVLDTTSLLWLERKRLWLSWGLNSGGSREEAGFYNMGLALGSDLPKQSIFNPVLTEIMYRWFTPKKNCKILDPFAGGVVRGIIASFFGHDYHGLDIRQEQIDENEKQWLHMVDRMPKESVVKPTWYLADALNIDQTIKDRDFDMLLTCPPYYQMEKYSKDPADFCNLLLKDYLDKTNTVIQKCASMLKQNSFAVWVTTNTRDPKTRALTNINHHVIKAFLENGFFLINEFILVLAVASLPQRVQSYFKKRLCGPRHEHVLVFFKGEYKDVPEIDLDVVDIPAEEGEDNAN